MKPALRILIIEDLEDDALLVLHHIKKGNFDIEYERVETADKMKRLLTEKPWDIVLSDFKMPHFNGLEALSILKETGLDIPFIVISGTIGEDVAVETMRAGAQDYIMKNNLKRLLPAIERELRQAEGRKQRKRLEAEQKRAQEQMHLLGMGLEAAANCIVITNKDGTIRWVNRAFTELTGYTTEEAVGQNPRILKSDKQDASFYAHLWQTILSGNVWHGKMVNRRKEGSLYTEEATITPVHNRQGQITHFIAVKQDITQRIQAEQERERLLAILTAKNEELEGILYVSSHDLKSPLVNIQGFSGELNKYCQQVLEIAKEYKPCANDRQLRVLLQDNIPEALYYIQTSASKMYALLNGLLKVSRISTTNRCPEIVDMNQLIREVLISLTFQMRDKQAEVTIDKLPDCYGDKEQISQVFTNLLSNALKYLSPERKGRISVTGHVENDLSIYCVEDNGIGIFPQYHQKIFEMFHRLNPLDAQGGEGIGLTIVKRIVQSHNGKVWIESQENQGCRIFVALPRSHIQQ